MLSCEFDYAQNLILPKLSVSDQFYKRKLYMYLFNVHNHVTNNSYMYPYLEGHAKKGANTICSFLQHAIDHEFDQSCYSKIILFSDAAGVQNLNYTVFTYLALLSSALNVEITHILPVRGHSYCQCDRNFGLYAEKRKKMGRIETPQQYFDLIEKARDPPFIVVKNLKDILIDFEKAVEIKNCLQKPRGMKISEARVIKHSPNHEIQVFDNFLEENVLSFQLNLNTKMEELEKCSPPLVGITRAKINDVKKLTVYLSNEGKQFYKDYFSRIKIKAVKKGKKGSTKKRVTSSDDDPDYSDS